MSVSGASGGGGAAASMSDYQLYELLAQGARSAAYKARRKRGLDFVCVKRTPRAQAAGVAAEVAHLAALGFPRVHNVNVDCYAAQRERRVPEFDVLVTNPPFSGAHLARALEFAGGCGKPFFMLAPDFLMDKP